MGEANYYLKARFESEEKAIEALPKIKEILGERFGDEDDGYRIGRDGSVIQFDAMDSHLASWDDLAESIKKGFGAIKIDWLSDEYMDPYEILKV